jgi:anti-sigma regulatory factor (Ser/Thr protein kinase)
LTLAPASLTLSASARSVQDARRWVVEACHRIGRSELADCAEQAVSELVTNALLHAEPPLTLRLAGTAPYPRIEVSDGSAKPPAPNERMTDDDELLSTVGRGLGIVAMCSVAWGARIHRHGKVVWFVPASEPQADADLGSPQIEYDEIAPRPEPTLEDPVTIKILELPVPAYLDFRNHYQELRRELRLLALASGSTYAVAGHLSELFRLFERDFQLSSGAQAVQRAMKSGAKHVDVEVVVDRSSIATVAHMIDVLELADAFCKAERLLSLAATPEQRHFTRWYLGEFVRQGRGHPPMAYPEAVASQPVS